MSVSLYDERKHGVKLPEYVEQPEIYMICMSSSSVDEQQLSFLTDQSVYHHCHIPYSVVMVWKSMLFYYFVGNHKAITFEQGAQCGGNFPCGTCGIHVSKFIDQTHALR